MKKLILLLLALTLAVSLAACSVGKEQTDDPPTADNNNPVITESDNTEPTAPPITENTEPTAPPETENTENTEDKTEMKMTVKIGNAVFTATLEDNAATRELMEMMKQSPITINMSDYSGFEKVGPLGRSLTMENHQTTTSAGDIVLYNGNQIVMFYGSNSWSYTRIGKIDDLTGWKEALGSGSITAEFSISE